MLAAASIMLEAALIGIQPTQVHGDSLGAIEIAAARLCWGIDNNLTQRISLRGPVAVARIKTLAGGTCVFVLALWTGEGHLSATTALFSTATVGALRDQYGVGSESASLCWAPHVNPSISPPHRSSGHLPVWRSIVRTAW